MKEPFVITISREVGSGGRTIGRKLAEKLGVRFSDKELIDALQAKLNLSPNKKEILNGIADEGSCVIAGRSGFFVLKDRPNKVDILITASKENRIARIMRKQGLSREKAQEVIETVDKARDNYVLRYTGQSRYDARNYHMVLNMDYLTEDKAVELILSYLDF